MTRRTSAVAVVLAATVIATGAHADGLGGSVGAAPPVIAQAVSPVPTLAFPGI